MATTIAILAIDWLFDTYRHLKIDNAETGFSQRPYLSNCSRINVCGISSANE